MGVDCPGWPAAMPMRTASYSPGWALLAGIRSDGAVALWDVRQACAAAVVKLPDSERAMFVHLDPALEAFGARETPVGAPPGHLLASSGNGVLIFDVRRLEGGGAAPAVSLLVAKAFTPLVLIDDDASTHKPKEVSTVSQPARYPIQYGFPARTVSQPERYQRALNGHQPALHLLFACEHVRCCNSRTAGRVSSRHSRTRLLRRKSRPTGNAAKAFF